MYIVSYFSKKFQKWLYNSFDLTNVPNGHIKNREKLNLYKNSTEME